MLEYTSWSSLLTDGENGDAVIAVSDEGEYRLSDLRERAASLAAALSEAGVRTAAVCTDDQRRLLESLAGCFMAGVRVFLPNSFDRSHFTLVGDHFEAVLSDGSIDLSFLRGKKMLRIDSLASRTGCRPRAFDERSARCTLFTSGSTGTPKEDNKTARELILRAVGEYPGVSRCYGRGQRVFATVPCRHGYGLTSRVMLPLLTLSVSCPRAIASQGEFGRIPEGSLLVTSPSFIKRLDPEGRKAPCANVMAAGGRMTLEAIELSLKVLGVPVLDVYGSTETGVIATRLDDAPGKPWIPLPGYHLYADAEGRLHVDRDPVHDGRDMLCGDYVSFNEDGTFVLRGRIGREVKIEDTLVSLNKVEGAIGSDPWIAGAAAVDVRHKEREGIGCAVVLSPLGLRETGGMTPGKILIALRERSAGKLSPIERPRYLRIVERIEENAMSKVPREWVLGLFEGND